jgi:hypothetical protein
VPAGARPGPRSAIGKLVGKVFYDNKENKDNIMKENKDDKNVKNNLQLVKNNIQIRKEKKK